MYDNVLFELTTDLFVPGDLKNPNLYKQKLLIDLKEYPFCDYHPAMNRILHNPPFHFMS